MTSLEHSYPTTASPGYPSTAEAQENDLKSNLIKMIEAFKEEMNKSLKEIQENTIKQVKEMSKAVKDLKVEIEAGAVDTAQAANFTDGDFRNCLFRQELDKGIYDFSFSGLKAFVVGAVH